MRHFTDQEIIDRIDQAPPQVQERVGDPRTAREIAAIGKSKNLHIDQIGKVAEMIRNLLLGLVNPQEFLQELIAAGITELDARQIMTEINQKIFIPLRESMKNAATGLPTPAKPSVPQPRPQIPPRSTGTPAPVAPSTAQPQRYFHLQNKLPAAPRAAAPVAAPMPIAPQPPQPISVQPQSQKSALAAAIASAQQRLSTPAQPKSVNMLSAEPKPQPQPVPVKPPISLGAPLPPKAVLPQPMLPRPAQPAAPRAMIPPRLAGTLPVNLPGAMPPLPIPEMRPSPRPSVAPSGVGPTIPKVGPQSPKTPPKPYSADPYREPIE